MPDFSKAAPLYNEYLILALRVVLLASWHVRYFVVLTVIEI